MIAITVERLSNRSFFYILTISLVGAVNLVLLSSAQTQQVDLPAGSDADHKRLIKLRTEAQEAQRDAQIAALRRAATQSTDKNNRDSVLERARRDKDFKRRAALAVQQQQAINAYEKVKQAEIDSWNGKGKKVTPGVPADFTANLPPLEEDSKKKGGLLRGVAAAPGKALKGLSSLRPGFLGGKKKQNEVPVQPAKQFAPPESLNLDTVAPTVPEPIMTPVESAPVEQSKSRGFKIPLISNLTGGKNKNEDLYAEDEQIPTSSQQPALEPVDSTLADDYPPEEKKGFFKGIASRIPIVGNKKEGGDDNPYYYENTDGEDGTEEKPKSGFLSKLSLKKNKDFDSPEVDSDQVESSGSSRKNIYVVDSSKAQFFPFGESGRQSGSQPLGEGTVVRMTKTGDDWSSIELSSGSMGVIRNKHLRRAKSGEVPSNMFAHKPKTPYPTTARISKTRSAIGKNNTEHRYREPVSVPLPDLPAGGTEPDTPIGNGLLPPLQESTIQ